MRFVDRESRRGEGSSSRVNIFKRRAYEAGRRSQKKKKKKETRRKKRRVKGINAKDVSHAARKASAGAETRGGTDQQVEGLKGSRVFAVSGASSNLSAIPIEDVLEKQENEPPTYSKEGEKEQRESQGDCRVLRRKTGSEIGPGCSQEQDAENAVTLEGKILTVFNKFLTTSPLVNKVKLLMVSIPRNLLS